MGLTRQELIDLAARYVSDDERTDFPNEGDVFCLLVRELPIDKVLLEEEGWAFRGYGLCVGYALDEEYKPRGKWLWMHFASLDQFPPVQQVLKLQPPHIVKGRFQNPERTHEFRILKVGISDALDTLHGTAKDSAPKAPATTTAQTPSKNGENVVKFRAKKK